MSKDHDLDAPLRAGLTDLALPGDIAPPLLAYLYLLARSYYGGLHATLRAATDPETEKDERRRAVLVDHEGEIYYRYALVESQDDMSDVMFFFMSTYAPKIRFDHSGRYERIFLTEVDAGGLVTV